MECAAKEKPLILTTREKIIKYYFPIWTEYTGEYKEIKVTKYDQFDNLFTFIGIIFDEISTNYYLEGTVWPKPIQNCFYVSFKFKDDIYKK